MSEEALYERYKSTLRDGHVAAVRGDHQAAVAAYTEAAALAPDRPLPHSSIGRALLRLDRVDEALAAFATALRLAPRDEAGLAGRVEALIIAGRVAEAAGVLDLLADTQETAGRLPDACDTARRALELAPSRARRRHLEALVAELQSWPTEGEVADQLTRALEALKSAASPAPAATDPPAAVADPAEVPATAPAEASDGAAATVDVETDAVAETTVDGAAETTVDGAAETTVDGAAAELPGRAPIGEPGPDPVALTRAVEAAVATGDAAIVHTAVLDAVAALRRGGLLDAAIDACQLGLTVAPADPGLHLALAELDLDHGWVAAAVDKLLILERYVILIGDGPTRERLHELAAERIPDDPRLSALRA